MHISIFSQNLANKTVVSHSRLKPKGIYIEFTQENALTHYTSLLSASSLYISEQLNGRISPFNIITKVFCDPSLIKSHSSGVIHLQSGSGTTLYTMLTQAASVVRSIFNESNKGVVWIKLNLATFSLLLMNMHLPVDPTSADYGNEYRTKCFKESMDSLSHLMDDKTLLIVGGDLNFRMEGKKDQLTTLLHTYKPCLHDLTGPEATCKFTMNSSGIRSFDTSRTPSRCDRILANKSIAVTSKSIVLDPELDHNGVFVEFEYSKGGTRLTKSKRMKKYRTTR